jgi:hypothetical protein
MKQSEETFSDIFLREHTDLIVVEGREIRRRLVLPGIEPGGVLRVTFERYQTSVPQGINLSTKKGKFEAAGERSADIVLWVDTAPEVVDLRMTNQVPADVVIWNTWRGWGGWPTGSTGYAGMLVETLNDHSWRLRCSDGVGGPDFDDLVVTVQLIRP